jgi:hypothetical protein
MRTHARNQSLKTLANLRQAGQNGWRLLPRPRMLPAMQIATKPAALLGRILQPLGECLTRTSAKRILSLRAEPASRRRIQRLAAKCAAGTLTLEERAEYQLFVEVGDMVALLKAKARQRLGHRRAA